METQKIKLSLPLELVVILYHNIEPKENFDKTIERFLRIALKTPNCIGNFNHPQPPNRCPKCDLIGLCLRITEMRKTMKTSNRINDTDSFKPMIEKAKQLVIHATPHPIVIKDRQRRNWIEANIDSYAHGYQRVSLLVLEGSPPRGYVIVNYATQTVTAFDSTDTMLKQLRNI